MNVLKYSLCVLLLSTLPSPVFGCEPPDETSMFYGSKEGFYILEVVWSKRKYQLKITGDPLSKANETMINEWVAMHCTEPVLIRKSSRE